MLLILSHIKMEEAKRKVILEEYYVRNTAESDYPGAYSSDYDEVKFSPKKVSAIIVKYEGNEIEFDLIGVSCAIANAFRRIMLSEVPSMAIEKVFVSNNTSLIKDEVLAHRLGLVPLKANPALFEHRPEGATEPNENDTLEYELKIKCTLNNEGDRTSQLPNDLYKNHCVYSGHIKWVPMGSQASTLTEDDVKPVFDDILLNKMRPGQELDLKLHAVKGIGKDHAKFSPVATAYYRMMPEITLLKEVTGEKAVLLQKCFSPGVIETEEGEDGTKRAVVADARYDSCSRNVFRYPELKDCVQMARIRNHFIFNVESVGTLPPHEIFLEAVKILKNKCRKYLKELNVEDID